MADLIVCLGKYVVIGLCRAAAHQVDKRRQKKIDEEEVARVDCNAGLLAAVSSGDVEAVRSCIAQGADVNYVREHGIGLPEDLLNPLQRIAFLASIGNIHAGHLAVFEELLKHPNIDPNLMIDPAYQYRDRYARRLTTSMSEAFESKVVELPPDHVFVFIIEGAVHMDSLLTHPSAKPLFHMLLRNPAYVNRVSPEGVEAGCTLLHLLCGIEYEYTNAELLREALTVLGAQVNATNTLGKTALHYAAERSSPLFMQALLATPGINPSVGDQQAGNTPLHAAAIKFNLEVVKALLAAPNVDASKRNKEGQTPRDALEKALKDDSTCCFCCTGESENKESAEHISKVLEAAEAAGPGMQQPLSAPSAVAAQLQPMHAMQSTVQWAPMLSAPQPATMGPVELFSAPQPALMSAVGPAAMQPVMPAQPAAAPSSAAVPNHVPAQAPPLSSPSSSPPPAAMAPPEPANLQPLPVPQSTVQSAPVQSVPQPALMSAEGPAAMQPVMPALPVAAPLSAVQTVQLVCPPGVQPGQLMQFQAPSGQMLQIPLPAGVAPGQAFHVQIPG